MLDLLFDLIPGLFDYWGERRDRKARAGALKLPSDRCLQCDYDLTGSLAARREECPECGGAIRKWQAPQWQREERRRSLRRNV